MTTRQKNRLIHKFLLLVMSFIFIQSELLASNIYSISYSNSSNTLHSIERDTGVSTLLKNFSFADTGNNSWIGQTAIIQSTMKIYTASSSGVLYEFNLVDGSMVTHDMNISVQSIFSSGNNLYVTVYDSENKLYKVDPTDGTSTFLSSIQLRNNSWIGNLAVLPSVSRLFTVSNGSWLHEYDLSSGTFLKEFQMDVDIQTILTDNQNTLYGISYNTTQTTATLYRINRSIGTTTLIKTFSIDNGQHWVNSVTVDGANNIFSMVSTPENKLYNYNLTNGNFIQSNSLSSSISSADSIQSLNEVGSTINNNPTITGTPLTSINEDSAYSFQAIGSDMDIGSDLIYSIVNKPAWASFYVDTGILSGTPTDSDVGDYQNIIISVTDGGASASLASFNIKVVNINSVITDLVLSVATIAENQSIGATIGTLSAIGVESNVSHSFTFSCAGADNASYAIDGSALKSAAIFDYETKSSYSICVNVNDGFSSVDKNLIISITDVNEVPTSANISVTIDEDETKTFASSDFTFTDVDNTSIHSITITALPSLGSLKLNGVNVGLSQTILNTEIAHLTYTPVLNESGVAYTTFGFKVGDGSLDSIQYLLTIHVTAIDTAPVLDTIDNVFKQRNFSTFNISPSANDAESDSIVYSAVSSNTGLVSVTMNGDIIEVSSVSGLSGSSVIEVTATANGLVDTSSFTVIVNLAPVINISDTNIEEDTNLAINLDVNVTDAENNTSMIITASSDNLTLATVSIADGVLLISTMTNQTGTFNLEINASDGYNLGTKIVVITVVEVEDIPDIPDPGDDGAFVLEPNVLSAYKSDFFVSGVHYIAYSDADNGGKLSIMKEVGGVWSYVAEAISTGVATDISAKYVSRGRKATINYNNNGNPVVLVILKSEL